MTARKYVPRRLRRDLGPRWHIEAPGMTVEAAWEMRRRHPWMRSAILTVPGVVIRRLR